MFETVQNFLIMLLLLFPSVGMR